MQDSIQVSKVVRFETFELNLKTGELRKGGVKIRLQEQSFQILAALLERPGKLVTRETLHERLWPDETFVDFEKGLNIAVSKLRQALGDSADEARFIETLPRRGYRFVGVIEQIDESGEIVGLPAGTAVERTISHYRLLEKIGEGGMGVVYKALDTKLNRTVALKFLPAHLTQDPLARERFRREAQAGAALDHPNICTVHEIDEVDGQIFIAMAYVEGQSLDKKIAAGPLALDEAVDIAIQTAGGLRAAHEKGVVHRDIKSSNLMVTPEGQVKILDFGLARLADQAHLTQTATVVGTPSCMSPEQVQRKPTDRRTDIWSAGVVVYEMVTGRLPFEGERQEAVLYAIANEDPEPIAALRAGLPRELERIVDKALAKDAEERYQRVDEMMDDLRSLLEVTEPGSAVSGMPGSTRRRSTSARPPRDKGRISAGQPNRRLGALAAVVGFLGIGAAVWWGARNDASVEPVDSLAEIASIVVLPFENLSGDPEQEFFSDGMSSEVIGNLRRVKSLGVISWTTARRYKNTDKSAPEIAAELDVSHLLEGSVLRAGDDLRVTVRLTDARQDRQIWSDSFEGPLTGILRLHREVAQAVAPEIEGRLTLPRRGPLSESDVPPEAYVAYLKGFAVYRERLGVSRAMAYFEECIDAAPDFAPAHAGIALMYQDLSWGGAMSIAEAQSRARAAMRKALSLDPNQPTALRVKADSALYDWDWAGAKEIYEGALEAFPSHSGIRVSHAHVLAIHGRFEDARKEILRAYRLDPQAFETGMHVGAIHHATRDYDAAGKYARRQEKAFPGSGLLTLAEVAILREQYDEAASFCRQGPPGRDWPIVCLVYAYGLKGDRVAAVGALDQLERRAASNKHVSPLGWAISYIGLGDKDKALEWLEQAYEERDPSLIHLGLDPKFDPLRSEPRFRALVEKMNLPFSYPT